MSSKSVPALVAVLLAVALSVTGCKTDATGGPAQSQTPAPSSTSSASATADLTPSAGPSPTITSLSRAAASQAGATPGTTATIVPDPADAPDATKATTTPTETRAQEKLVDQLTSDTGINVDSTAEPAITWVTVYSSDKTLSMDVPSTWTYASFKNRVGGSTFGASEGSLNRPTQRVLTGTRTDSLDEFLSKNAYENGSVGCTPGPVRPYEEARFIGQAQVLTCESTNLIDYAIDGKGDLSGYHGFFMLVATNAVGVAAVHRGISSLEVH